MKPGDKNKDELLEILRGFFGDMVALEYRFHPVRKWRFDYAVPELKLAVEYDGINYGGHAGRHSSLVGMTQDNEKINRAIIMGWRVLRFTKKNFDKTMAKGISSARDTIQHYYEENGC